jgi:hypothetical protein
MQFPEQRQQNQISLVSAIYFTPDQKMQIISEQKQDVQMTDAKPSTPFQTYADNIKSRETLLPKTDFPKQEIQKPETQKQEIQKPETQKQEIQPEPQKQDNKPVVKDDNPIVKEEPLSSNFAIGTSLTENIKQEDQKVDLSYITHVLQKYINVWEGSDLYGPCISGINFVPYITIHNLMKQLDFYQCALSAKLIEKEYENIVKNMFTNDITYTWLNEMRETATKIIATGMVNNTSILDAISLAAVQTLSWMREHTLNEISFKSLRAFIIEQISPEFRTYFSF